MKCILMNKNTEVLVAEYNEDYAGFTEIYNMINIDYSPLVVSTAFNKNLKTLRTLNIWFKERSIPEWRDKLDVLLRRLNVSYPADLLNKYYAVSLSDQYWIKPFGSDITYDNVNLFDNDFDASLFIDATFSNMEGSIKDDSVLKTPNNTTDGMIKKSWTIESGKRVLLKGGYKHDVLQPFNEVLASMISKKLGFNHVEYSLDVVHGNIVSKCECFINKDTELISAYQILHNNIKEENKDNAFDEYIKILEEHGIKNVREKLENMFILDFIMLNEDRHLNNFGVIRDVNTLEWLDVAPIFDNGQSLNLTNFMEVPYEGKFFYKTISFDELIKLVQNIKRIEVSLLDDVVKDYFNLLEDYKSISNISDEYINALCILLKEQIEKLRGIITEG